MKQILVFVLLSAILCWFMFAPVYKHLIIMRQAVLQQEVDYLLEVGANGSHGYIDGAMVAASQARLADRGFDVGDLVYEVSAEDGTIATDPGAPVMRGIGIRLVIRYPYGNLFAIDRLIGIEPPADVAMGASGMKMSEYVP